MVRTYYLVRKSKVYANGRFPEDRFVFGDKFRFRDENFLSNSQARHSSDMEVEGERGNECTTCVRFLFVTILSAHGSTCRTRATCALRCFYGKWITSVTSTNVLRVKTNAQNTGRSSESHNPATFVSVPLRRNSRTVLYLKKLVNWTTRTAYITSSVHGSFSINWA